MTEKTDKYTQVKISKTIEEENGKPAKMPIQKKRKSIFGIIGASTALLLIAVILITFIVVLPKLLNMDDQKDISEKPTAAQFEIDSGIEGINKDLSELDLDISYEEFEDSEISFEPSDDQINSTISEIDEILQLSDTVETDLEDFKDSDL